MIHSQDIHKKVITQNNTSNNNDSLCNTNYSIPPQIHLDALPIQKTDGESESSDGETLVTPRNHNKLQSPTNKHSNTSQYLSKHNLHSHNLAHTHNQHNFTDINKTTVQSTTHQNQTIDLNTVVIS